MSRRRYIQSNKSCSDYACPTVDDIKNYFDCHPVRFHHNEPMVYILGEQILKRMGHSDILSAPIKKRDLDKFMIETVFFLARRLAVFMVVPQRYGGQARNMIATSINSFSGRIYRFRVGHKMPTKTRRQINKRALSSLIDDLVDDGYLWHLAEKLVKSYRYRLENGTCEAM